MGRIRGLFVAVAMVALAACSSAPDVNVETIAMTMAEKANKNSPVAVDLVLVGEEKLAEQILKLSAADWFTQREQLGRDYPTTLQWHSWELVPGQRVPATEVKRKDDLWAAFVFANYLTPGVHRVRVFEQENVQVRLGENGFTVDP